jgi:hypothetical protein
MNDYGQFRAAALDVGIPSAEIDTFTEFLRFTIWANPRHMGRIIAHPRGLPPGQTHDLLVGRLGGSPRLPVGMPWPVGREFPLPFVASFDCARLPRVDGLALPPDGSLLVFLDHELAYEPSDRGRDQKYARLLHVPAGTATEVAEHAGLTAPERDLFAVVHAALPGWMSHDDEDDLSEFQQRVARALPHREQLRAVVDRLWPAGNSATVQFGGYSWGIGAMATDHLYESPELTMAEQNLPTDDELLLEEELQRVRREWIPLVQFETTDDAYIGRFLIRVEDLAADRLDSAVSWTEFTE